MNVPSSLETIDVSRVHRSAAYRAVVGGWQRPALIGCSGGVDSAALLVASSVASAKRRVGPIVAVHVDHRVRAGSGGEARFVAGLAARLGVPFVATAVCYEAVREPGGLEASLRARRYRAFARVGERLGIDTVVVAHTFDDQIETVLLRLLSGASSLAALGMQAERELVTAAGPLKVLRPFLDLRHAELAGLLDDAGVPHIEDPSNDDLRFRRNRIRHRLIPELEWLDPGFGQGLLRSVRHASRDAELAEQIAREDWERAVTVAPGRVTVDRSFVRRAQPAVTSRVLLWSALELIVGDSRELTFERIEAVRVAASGRTGATIELPYGLIAKIEREGIVIGRRPDLMDR